MKKRKILMTIFAISIPAFSLINSVSAAWDKKLGNDVVRSAVSVKKRDKELADFLGINEDVIENYKREGKSLSDIFAENDKDFVDYKDYTYKQTLINLENAVKQKVISEEEEQFIMKKLRQGYIKSVKKHNEFIKLVAEYLDIDVKEAKKKINSGENLENIFKENKKSFDNFKKLYFSSI